MDKLSENNLIALAKSGDEAAREQLFNNYKQLVSAVVRHYFLIGGDQDDLMQEGSYGLFKAITNFDETKNDNFGAYAKTLIEHQVINAIKSDNALKNSMLNQSLNLNNQGFVSYDDDDDGPIFAVPSNKLTPENLILSNEGTKNIAKEIKNVLSNYELKVLKLYLKGLNYNDIAGLIDATPKSVDNALNRIKNKLQFLKERS